MLEQSGMMDGGLVGLKQDALLGASLFFVIVVKLTWRRRREDRTRTEAKEDLT